MPDALLCDICELKRLQILENAVVNYSGGVFNLERKALAGMLRLENNYPEVSEVLAEIAHYLHGLIEAGRLRDSPLYCGEYYRKSLVALIGG